VFGEDGAHPAAGVVIHVVTNAAIPATGTAGIRKAANSVPGERPPARPAAIISGRGFLSAEAVADLLAHGAKVRTVATPAQDAGPESRYRPSTALDEFIRARDLTCRFPGCDKPAVKCDIDHSEPWGSGGHMHPSKLHGYCRLHHLLKTFWDGWTEVQYPDGRLTITTPTGHSYTTIPLSAVLFPEWDTTTGPAPPPGKPRRTCGPGRTLKMPARTQSRAKTRAQRIERERARNHAQILAADAAAKAAAREAGKPEPAGTFDPPPF
jgi:hypothetical protein